MFDEIGVYLGLGKIRQDLKDLDNTIISINSKLLEIAKQMELVKQVERLKVQVEELQKRPVDDEPAPIATKQEIKNGR